MDFQDARVGDGDFEDVGGKVFEACLRGRDGLGVDVPVDEPDFRGDLIGPGTGSGLVSCYLPAVVLPALNGGPSSQI
jgi:hypothetical protein